MVIVPAPSAAKHGLTLSGEIVCNAKPRLIEKGPGGESAQGNRRVALVPLKTAELKRRATGAELRKIKDRISEAYAVYPRLEMGGAQAEFEGQPAGDLPGILNKTFHGIVGDVVDAIERKFLISAGQGTGEQVGIGVTG